MEVLTLVILIRATVGCRERTVSGSSEPLGLAVAGTLVAVLLVFGVLALAGSPRFGSPVMERLSGVPAQVYLASALSRTGSANAVTAVLLDFRAYDTLGEATVLFTGIVGAVVVLRRKSRRRSPAAEE